MAISEVYATNGDNTVAKPAGVSEVFITNMPEGGSSSGVTSVNGQTGDVTLTASDVGALPDNTAIPTKTSDLQNDSGYITASDIPTQVQSDWNEDDSADPAYIKNKPSIPASQVNADWNASSGVAEILNKPTIPAAPVQSNWNESDSSSLAYIQNKPTIPAAQVNSDWNASSGVAEILNKPTIPTVDQTYNASSTNAQSGVAVAGAISAATPTLADLNTAGITDIQSVSALPVSPVATVLYLIPEV